MLLSFILYDTKMCLKICESGLNLCPRSLLSTKLSVYLASSTIRLTGFLRPLAPWTSWAL